MEMALDVRLFMEKNGIKEPTIIGHDMGAKTALTLALNSPYLIKDVVAIENCPIHLPLKSYSLRHLQGLSLLQNKWITSHKQALDILKPCEKSLAIRVWLTSNFIKKPESLFLNMRVPIETLKKAVGQLGDFPYKDDLGVKKFRGRVLFLRTPRSYYIPETAFSSIQSFFPNSEIVDVNFGHWVVQEKPEEFRKIITEFLSPPETAD